MESEAAEFWKGRGIEIGLSLARVWKGRRKERAQLYLRHSHPQRKGCHVEGPPEAAAREADGFLMDSPL